MRLAIKDILPTTIQAFGPFCSYHFSRGLVFAIGQERAILKGGPELEKLYDLPLEHESAHSGFRPTFCSLVERIEQEIGVRLIAIAPLTSTSDSQQEFPPLKTSFRFAEYFTTALDLSEALLAKFQILELHSCDLIARQVDRNLLFNAAELVALTKDQTRDGQLGLTELDKRIEEMRSSGLPIREAFFLSNGKTLADATRDAILRACYHFANMTAHLYKANSQPINRYFPDRYKGAPCEIVHASEVTDTVAHEFASSVISCYSSLDLLYDWFVYHTRAPFGKPDLPNKLHFPDDPIKVFVSGGLVQPSDVGAHDAPYAIPNLRKDTFLGLRRLRNDLVHNMAHDQIRSRLYIGIGLPPVNNEKLQYSQYVTRDVDAQGIPTTHPWVRSFYKDQDDAQHRLHDWIAATWQCLFDTTEWLTNRIQKM